jgi:hypothetical protein
MCINGLCLLGFIDPAIIIAVFVKILNIFYLKIGCFSTHSIVRDDIFLFLIVDLLYLALSILALIMLF